MTTSIADVLFSGVQQRVLGLLFGQADRSFYANEIAKLALTGKGALQRELIRMTDSGLVRMTVIGRQKHYQANKECPIFEELRSITLKTFGLADVVRNALLPFGGAIQCAFIFGSVAKQTDSADSDIDLMIIADGLAYSDLYEALATAEQFLGRKLSPTLYSVKDFLQKIADQNHFVTRVLSQASIALIGDKHAVSQRQIDESGANRTTQDGASGPA
jgi:predicted nucleotidyltransferase